MIDLSQQRSILTLAAHVLVSVLLVASGGRVFADNASSCAQAAWVEKLSANDWTEVEKIPQEAEVMAFTLYRNKTGEQQLVVGYHNVIWAGEIKVIHLSGRYNTAFDYRVHNDTTGPIDGPTIFVAASYDAENGELAQYCYEIQNGNHDIARRIAHDQLLFVLKMSTELLQ